MRKIVSLYFIVFFLGFVVPIKAADSGVEKVKSALNEYAWEKRQLVVFSPTSKHKQYQIFKAMQLEFSEDFEERNLHSWHVVGNDSVKLDSRMRAKITSQDFRNTFNVDENKFRLLLIGYDQGEKLRQKQVNIDYVFSEIDQMPMRIQEMQE